MLRWLTGNMPPVFKDGYDIKASDDLSVLLDSFHVDPHKMLEIPKSCVFKSCISTPLKRDCMILAALPNILNYRDFLFYEIDHFSLRCLSTYRRFSVICDILNNDYFYGLRLAHVF